VNLKLFTGFPFFEVLPGGQKYPGSQSSLGSVVSSRSSSQYSPAGHNTLTVGVALAQVYPAGHVSLNVKPHDNPPAIGAAKENPNPGRSVS